MRVATWNVNSLRVRLPQVLEWLTLASPDVLGLQETKLTDGEFPIEALAAAGYQAVFAGQKTYNGVALLARELPEDPVTELVGFEDPQRRVMAGTVGGVRIWNLYVPNGQSVDSDKYTYKLGWLAALRETLAAELEKHERVIVMGDFNIAPDDRDVHDPAAWAGKVLCSEPERSALTSLLDLGLEDLFRRFDQAEDTFSWWDYRAGGFRRNHGLRIDLILGTAAMADTCTTCVVDRAPRAWERPSDHAPVMAEFEGGA
ncbi:MAG: exodeoxyribonuclease III [Gammaproteobacteria bacterium]|nr:MAG: exodeoxyribonuclease III [Gammaproteobacteria bacterium]